MFLKIVDLLKPFTPKIIIDVVCRFDARQVLIQYVFRMHPGYQHILVMGQIENTELSPFRKCKIVPPQVVVSPFESGWHFKAVHNHTPGIEVLKYFEYQAVFPGSIHSLQANQYTFGMCIKYILSVAQILAYFFQFIFDRILIRI